MRRGQPSSALSSGLPRKWTMADRDPVARVAESIADASPVDWDGVESGVRTERERAVVRRLKRIGQIAALHRTDAPVEFGEGAETRGRRAAATLSESWGHLRLVEKLAKGSFGDVYRAWDPRLDREVALKVLWRDAQNSRADAAIDEARLLARVRHPNVVTVYGADRIGGSVGMWMDLIHGRTLEQVLHDHGPLSAREATVIGLDLCRALAAVHRAGLVHRDLKAQNVMRESGGRIVLMDF